MSGEFEIACPNCGEYIIIEQINCAIFRHGVYKHTMCQINPHAPKAECDELKEKDLIYGCGKPFRIVKKEQVEETTQDKTEKLEKSQNSNSHEWIGVVCDYI